jgi:hypothetical protein
MISDKAGCDRRKGSPLRSDERAEERAPLTAVASGQIMQLSGTKKTKEISSGQNNQERPFTQNPGHYPALPDFIGSWTQSQAKNPIFVIQHFDDLDRLGVGKLTWTALVRQAPISSYT